MPHGCWLYLIPEGILSILRLKFTDKAADDEIICASVKILFLVSSASLDILLHEKKSKSVDVFCLWWYKNLFRKEFNQLERNFACNLSLGLHVSLLSFSITR